MSVAIENLRAHPHLNYVKVQTADAVDTILAPIFKNVLEPLYGDQTSALNKIKQGEDRICLLAQNDQGEPVGVLQYKTILSNEYGLDNSLEIKSLFVVEPGSNSGKGIGSALLDTAIKAAQAFKTHSIHLTVSETKIDSLNFFNKKGFKIIETFPGPYKKNVNEYLLKLDISEEKTKE